MTKKGRKKPKPGAAERRRPRNPFAGRPRSGAGFHEKDKYGKKERREQKQELETESEPLPDE